MLIDVAKIVLKKHNDWRWVVCGEGEERKRLEEKIEKNKFNREPNFEREC